MKHARSGRLEISIEQASTSAGQIAIVRVSGEVDLETAEEFAGALQSDTCRQSSATVLDLLGVPFMDSSGLRAVLIAADEEERDLVVVLSPGSPVLRLFEMTGVDRRVPAFATESEAIDAIAPGSSQPA
jgi:anti-anti-sigma factor